MSNKFKVHIGDWSSDGHGREEVFTIEANASVEDFRDAYTEFCSKHLDLERLCCEYEDSSITAEQVEILKDLQCNAIDMSSDDDDESISADPEDLVKIMMWACKYINSKLEYEIVDDDIPTFHNYGFDKKGRHIHGPGYGCFCR